MTNGRSDAAVDRRKMTNGRSDAAVDRRKMTNGRSDAAVDRRKMTNGRSDAVDDRRKMTDDEWRGDEWQRARRYLDLQRALFFFNPPHDARSSFSIRHLPSSIFDRSAIFLLPSSIFDRSAIFLLPSSIPLRSARSALTTPCAGRCRLSRGISALRLPERNPSRSRVTNLNPGRGTPDQLVADLGARGRQLVERDLDPGQVALVVADPQQPEPLAAEPLLGLVDHPDPLGRDLLAVGDPAGEAGGRRLVPGGQAPGLGQGADVGLAQAAFLQRVPHAVLAGGPHARAGGRPGRRCWPPRRSRRPPARPAGRRAGRTARSCRSSSGRGCCGGSSGRRTPRSGSPGGGCRSAGPGSSASSSSPAARLSETAVTATAASPSASNAAWATTVLSIPPEYATATRP